ncbi:hypothetical protein ARMGADRAFT_1035991 [Armillaria gallica]|uniref:Uncharacterized protein n=1 Tax=Armillaria gallica TaxID=47427 RepID=A0A2H3CRX2_ARMGA|nr:hypothetical protein ARMGADRAFT_1035991 [Armillaria gallica]
MSLSKHFEQEIALSVVDITKHKELLSYPWRANSCWLDASLEALYMTLKYGDWKSFQLLFNEDADWMPPSLIYYFFLMMKGQNTPAQELLDLHDGFCTFLYKMKIVSGHEDTYQDGLEWFQTMIAPGRSHIANEHPSAASDHVQIHKPLAERPIVNKPLTQNFEPCKGQIKNWLHSLTHIKLVSKGDPVSCWRGDDLKFWTWIPVILTIEPANQEEQNWDFPWTLAPLKIREAKDKGSTPPVMIYRLHGGASAQDYFTSQWLELCKKKLDIDLLTLTFLCHSWGFCRSQQNSSHEENSKVNLANQNNTVHLSLPPISTLPEDFDAVEKAIINLTNDEFFSPVEDISLLSSSPPPPTLLPILCCCGADSDRHRDEIQEQEAPEIIVTIPQRLFGPGKAWKVLLYVEETLRVQARNATVLKTLITPTPNTTLHTQTLKVLGGILCDRSRLKQYN